LRGLKLPGLFFGSKVRIENKKAKAMYGNQLHH
jgi:hypothetical protein